MLPNNLAVYVAGALTIAGMLSFKHEPWMLTVATALITTALILRKPTYSQIVLCASVFASAVAIEILIVSAGIWTYAMPHTFGIPLWIPFVWVNGALVFIQAKEDIEKMLRKRA